MKRMTDKRRTELIEHVRSMTLKEFCMEEFGNELYAEVLNGLEAESEYTFELEARLEAHRSGERFKKLQARIDAMKGLPDEWINDLTTSPSFKALREPEAELLFGYVQLLGRELDKALDPS